MLPKIKLGSVPIASFAVIRTPVGITNTSFSLAF